VEEVSLSLEWQTYLLFSQR